jgi:hypothetical protein
MIHEQERGLGPFLVFQVKSIRLAKSMRFSQTTCTLWLGLLALGLWLTFRPHYGPVHDEAFYAVLALEHMHPATYQSDLFFQYGSQGAYTIFSPFLAEMIRIWGFDNGLLIATILGEALWLGALACLASILIEPGLRGFALLAVALLPPYYSSLLSYGEPFVSARLYAEGLSLIGLCLWIGYQTRYAWLFLVLAALIHPLLGLPAIGLAMLVRSYLIRFKFLLGTIAALVALLVVLKAGPFAQLTHVLDPSLIALEEKRSPWLFLQHWEWPAYSRLLFVGSVLILAWKTLENPISRIAGVSLVIGLAGLGVAAIAAWSDSVLLLGLQTWRAMWLPQLLAGLFIVPVIARLWKEDLLAKATVILIGSACFSGDAAGFVSLTALLVRFGGKGTLDREPPGSVVKLLFWLIPLQGLIWSALNASVDLNMAQFEDRRPAWLLGLIQSVPWVVLVVGASVYFLPNLKRISIYALSIVAMCMLAIGFKHWDQRGAWNLFDTPERQKAIAPLQKAIPDGAVVYWEQGVVETWFWLKRADYISTVQLAGSIFSPDTAREGMRRMRLMEQAGFQDSSWDFRKPIRSDRVGRPHSILSLRTICSEPMLTYLILEEPVRELKGKELLDPNTGWKYHIYDCKKLSTSLTSQKLAESIAMPKEPSGQTKIVDIN